MNSLLSVDNVSNKFKLAKLGKACGVEGLATEHFIYAGYFTEVLYLSMLFTFFNSYCHLPDSSIKSTIVPLVINKTGDTNDQQEQLSLNCFIHSYV